MPSRSRNPGRSAGAPEALVRNPRASRKSPILTFRITLRDVRPHVWRRVQVPASCSFWDLHVAIQDAMGWDDSHLHRFEVVDRTSQELIEFGIPDPDASRDEPKPRPGWEFPIGRYFIKPGDAARYEYDFGDSWYHDVILEDVGVPEDGVRYPRCTGGRRACPPEDCGGPHGYERMLAALADPTHDHHQDMIDWLGVASFDRERFDAAKMKSTDSRKRLKRLLREM